jgi:hypothetical protein
MTHMTAPNEGAFYGLTKREFFAGLICACACANPEIEAFAEPVRIVADSVAIADELIRQLNEREDAS